MSAKYFLDTNIFIYSLDPTAPAKARRAARLIRDGLDTGNGIVCYQVVQEFFSIAFRRFAKPMSAFVAEEYLNTTFRPLLAVHSSQIGRAHVCLPILCYQVVQEFFSIAFRRFAKPMSAFVAEEYLNTTFRPLLAVHSSPALLVSALRVYAQHHLSWYDSLIVAAAQEAGCSILYSEDMQHGQRVDDLRIENPFR